VSKDRDLGNLNKHLLVHPFGFAEHVEGELPQGLLAAVLAHRFPATLGISGTVPL